MPSADQAQAMTEYDKARAVYRAAYYFNLFDYPAKPTELARLCGITDQAAADCVEQLRESGRIETRSGYVVFPGRAWTIGRRRRAEACFHMRYKRIKVAAWFLSHVPFVRGVFLTGRCSKGLLSEDDDFDFLVIAAKDRARLTWILIFLLRRLISLNYRNGNFRFLCCNYVLGEDLLALKEQDAYIAMELVWAFPIFNKALLDAFHRANPWHTRFFHQRGNALPDDLAVKYRAGVLQRLLELPLNIVWTKRVRARVDAFYQQRWLKLRVVKDHAECRQKAGDGYVKPETGGRRKFVVDRVARLDPDEHQSLLRTKVHLHRGLLSNGNAPDILLALPAAACEAVKGPNGDVATAADRSSLARFLRMHGYGVEDYGFSNSAELNMLFRVIKARLIPLVAVHVSASNRPLTLRLLQLCQSIGARVVLFGSEAVRDARFYLEHGADGVIAGGTEAGLLAMLDHISKGSVALEAIPGFVFDGNVAEPEEEALAPLTPISAAVRGPVALTQ
jgi:hypothetical protein